jgi:hypothetical protein
MRELVDCFQHGISIDDRTIQLLLQGLDIDKHSLSLSLAETTCKLVERYIDARITHAWIMLLFGAGSFESVPPR